MGYKHSKKLNKFSGSTLYSGSTDISDLFLPIGTPIGGDSPFTDGTGTSAIKPVDGYNTSSGYYSMVAGGKGNTASSYHSHAEGYNTTASGNYGSHSEGYYTTANGDSSHAEGYYTTASGLNSHAEGSNTLASGIDSHAEGTLTVASGNRSHAEGRETEASGRYSHAEGKNTRSYGWYSHSEGKDTLAAGQFSHAEGDKTIADGVASHAGGENSISSGRTSFIHSDSSVVEDYGSSIIGGFSNRLTAGATGSTILGGSGITGTTSDTVYAPSLNIGTLGDGSSDTEILTVNSSGLVRKVTAYLPDAQSFFVGVGGSSASMTREVVGSSVKITGTIIYDNTTNQMKLGFDNVIPQNYGGYRWFRLKHIWIIHNEDASSHDHAGFIELNDMSSYDGGLVAQGDNTVMNVVGWKKGQHRAYSVDSFNATQGPFLGLNDRLEASNESSNYIGISPKDITVDGLDVYWLSLYQANADYGYAIGTQSAINISFVIEGDLV